MRALRAKRTSAFTLIELLVVIAIIAMVAGLVVGLAGVAGTNKKQKRVQVELAKLVTLIEGYKAKVGVYPPQNPNLAPDRNTLLYELAGATRNNDPDPLYETPFGSIRQSLLLTAFGTNGVINAVSISADNEDRMALKRVLKDLHPDQYRAGAVAPNTASLVVPVDGPDGQPAVWNYRVGPDAVHNPDSFDLWVEIVVKGRTNVVGNWKN
ncbi:MAG TPA: type II secretion system protein [Candidatus Limnocylindria bacterium]|nr:type II secretion system protein [Candidatus Limnocylindria bacterium]